MLNQSQDYRRGIRSNRGVFFFVCLLVCAALIAASATGLLAPVEDLLAAPLNTVTSFFNRAALAINDNISNFSDMQTLQQRNADLERALAAFQAELVELREVNSDYQRLVSLLDYTTSVTGQEFVTADVISADTNSGLRTISINRGARDGIAVGMPVVTDQGLVGRVIQASANAARVMLITDTSSAVSARLQTTRVDGAVVGQISGNLTMTRIPLGQSVTIGDLVITSGLGGNFPADLVIGQVTSVRLSDNNLEQEAQVRSLIDFDTLEFVLVVTNFQPVDLSVFQEQAAEAGE